MSTTDHLTAHQPWHPVYGRYGSRPWGRP